MACLSPLKILDWAHDAGHYDKLIVFVTLTVYVLNVCQTLVCAIKGAGCARPQD